MLRNRALLLAIAVVTAGLLLVPGCLSQGATNTFYDSGAQDLTLTGQQLAQYVLYRFDTSGSSHTLTLPAASDILSQIGSPTVGQVFIIAVTAEGANSVTIAGGAGTTIKQSASSVAGFTTRNLYFVITNVSSGSNAVSIY
jgi:hypothetical protein